MSTTLTHAGFTQDAFDAFLAARDEPGWLTDLRTTAWRKFNELPMPSAGDEEWMRTDIRLLRLAQYGLPAAAGAGPVPPGLLSRGVDLAGQVTTLNSHTISAQIQADWAAKGVLFGPLDQLVAQQPDLVRRHLLCRAVEPHYDKFAALHAACWTGGALLYVPRGVVLDQPVHLLTALADGGVDLTHTLVILEEGAEATLLAESTSLQETGQGLHCGAVELLLAPSSNLRYVNLQDWGTGVWHFAHQKALVDRDAAIQWTIGALGARLAKVNQHVALVGPGATAQVNGVMFSEGRQHLCYHTLQHHEAPSCRSDLLYKGALQDDSRIVWRGMIKVDPGAQKTDGYQRNDNLILNPRARADSIPGLEIEADDVRCTHGATSGRVDDEQIFYCQARGLTRKEAIRMIVAGFFQQVSDRITIESVREALAEAVARRVREYE
ncbi:MAG: Fe-S cluster assembly protein SufD [Planctomycetales bacterium]|nr:Fe-S cluster assembly protein SufD [Planctomycetales bacterium]NIM08245.1 Fe-S cluster assembly protein SufD [Planctomycetales bacterium]NIN76863.1 Fe-S cluster assembly protein SufD [Planctomycetales bacterium]NIO34059.1 Fe-S cluster assembly protein SufD [Planctomycetales bacterium]NIO45849.1 Fe-S cluster assembly protein SufD [Planctomycetales bacterium]